MANSDKVVTCLSGAYAFKHGLKHSSHCAVFERMKNDNDEFRNQDTEALPAIEPPKPVRARASGLLKAVILMAVGSLLTLLFVRPAGPSGHSNHRGGYPGDRPAGPQPSTSIEPLVARPLAPPPVHPALNIEPQEPGLVMRFVPGKGATEDEKGRLIFLSDLSGMQNHAVQDQKKSRPELVKDELLHRNVISFRGSKKEHLIVQESDSLQNIAKEITLFARIRPERMKNNVLILGRNAGMDERRGWALKLSQGRFPQFDISRPGARSGVISDEAVEPGRWHHIAATFKEGRSRIYVEGEDVGTRPVCWPSRLRNVKNVPVRIGGPDPDKPSKGFEGLVDEIRVYSRVLSQDEIQGLINPNRPVDEDKPRLLLWNTLGSPDEIRKSRIGPGGEIYGRRQGRGLNFPQGKEGRGFSSSAGKSGPNFGPWEKIHPEYHKRGTIEFWWKAPRAYDDSNRPPDEVFVSGVWQRNWILPFQMLYRWREPDKGGGGFAFRISGQDRIEQPLQTGKVAHFKKNQWVRVAFVWDMDGLPIDKAASYGVIVDGVYHPLRHVNGGDPRPLMARPEGAYFAMGYYTADGHIQQRGVIDEVRIWDRPITGQVEVQIAVPDVIAEYKMDGNPLKDDSGQGNDLMVSSLAKTEKGIKGTAIQQNAIGGHLYKTYSPDSKLFVTEPPLTVTAWFKTEGENAPEPTILSTHYAGQGSDGYKMALHSGDDGGRHVLWSAGTGNNHIISSKTYDDGIWHLAVGTWDGAQLQLFVDGILQGRSKAEAKCVYANRPRFTIGAQDCNNAAHAKKEKYYFNGRIDEVRILRKVMTQKEVIEHFNETAPERIVYDGLVWYRWRTGFEIKDGKLITQPKARTGFQYGHSRAGRGGALVTAINDKDWTDYTVDFDFCMLPPDPGFKPHHIPTTDIPSMSVFFRVKDYKESWNEKGHTSYVLGVSSEGKITLSRYFEFYIPGRGYSSKKSGATARFVSGGTRPLGTLPHHMQLSVVGRRVKVAIDGHQLMSVLDSIRPGGRKPPMHGGIGIAWRYEYMGWIANVKVKHLKEK